MSEELKLTLKTIFLSLFGILMVVGVFFLQILNYEEEKEIKNRICNSGELGTMVFKNRSRMFNPSYTAIGITTICECTPADFRMYHQLSSGRWSCFSSKYLSQFEYIRVMSPEEEKVWNPKVEKYKSELINDLRTTSN